MSKAKKEEERIMHNIAATVHGLYKIYGYVLKTGNITDLVNNRKDVDEAHQILSESLNDLNNIIALKKLLKINNIN